MLENLKKLGLAALFAVGSMTMATTAEARERYRDGGDDAAIAIGAGIVGLAIGALLADRDDRYYNDRGRYHSRRYVRVQGYPDYYYYYQGNPNRYYRDRHYSRNYGRYYNQRSNNRWDRGYDRGDRYYRSDKRRYRDDRDYRRHDRSHSRRDWDRGSSRNWNRDSRRGDRDGRRYRGN